MLSIPRKMRGRGVWLHFGCVLSLLIKGTATRQDEFESLIAAEKQVCDGTLQGTTGSNMAQLKTRYANCTHVQGNLELSFIPPEADLDFLQHIREITGYLLIAYAKIPVINLPNLRIIRGRFLPPPLSIASYMSPQTNSSYSVLIMHNDELRELGLGHLREISHGPVYVHNNQQLQSCHLRSTVNWDDLLQENGAHVEPARDQDDPECSRCHSNCSTGYCWGPGGDQCQQLTKTICVKQCGLKRCHGPGPSDCCHPECAAGCTGPGANECNACQHFVNDGECVDMCPALEKYDSVHFARVPNPDGKLYFGTVCVKECPENFLRNDQYCIAKCPADKQEKDGACVACNGTCPKRNLVISKDSFSEQFEDPTAEGLFAEGGSFHEDPETGSTSKFAVHPGVEPRQLEQLSTVRKITGYLRVNVAGENVTDLSFLRNLETIEGRNLFDSRFALYIGGNQNLRSLGLNSLKTVKAAETGIMDNPLLCYGDQIAWNKILRVPSQAVVNNNRDRNQCVAAGEKCHSECAPDGCWGPNQNQCLFCAHYTYKSVCLRDCAAWNVSDSVMLYHGSNNVCAPCHEQCRGGCMGPSENNCTACLNVKDGPGCVAMCPMSKYVDSRNVCQQCHKLCTDGCTGPGSFVGQAGCTSCQAGIVSEGSTNRIDCLPAEASCPARYFSTITYNETGALATMLGKKMCQPCHPYCTKCRDGTVYNCQECMFFKVDGQCVLTCPNTTHYIEEGASLCQRCNSDCSMRGCSGSLSSQCVSCRLYRDYYDPDAPHLFNCTSQCPAERFYSTNQPSDPQIVLDPSEGLCTKDDPAAAKSTKNLIIGVVTAVVGVIIIVIIVLVLWFRIKRSKIQLETLIIQDKFAGIELTEPLEPTDNKPDTSKLRLISEQELQHREQLGQGAFGIVYKGLWLPPNENLKIPVAIKVLKEGVNADAVKEISDEAHVMASVNNPHLVTLLGLCMSSQIMLITQLLPLGSLLDYVKKNKKSITSRTLLNWCSQIAKGMKYLGKRHMIHRDLAARNVLVERPNWVKVTDFGLARIMDCHEDSVKSSGGLMPIKWLAPESIGRGLYSHKTDVWAFGVTIWEVLSYGQKQFENVPVRKLYSVLQSGERLPQPLISTLDVYMLLLRCWSSHPESRPTFEDLAEEFGKMTRDPGRYLVIPGDEYLRLPDYTADDQHRLFGGMEDVGSEKLMLAEDYINPRAAGCDPQHPDDGPPVPRYTPDPVALAGKHTDIHYDTSEPPPVTLAVNNQYLAATDSSAETTYLDLSESPKAESKTTLQRHNITI